MWRALGLDGSRPVCALVTRGGGRAGAALLVLHGATAGEARARAFLTTRQLDPTSGAPRLEYEQVLERLHSARALLAPLLWPDLRPDARVLERSPCAPVPTRAANSRAAALLCLQAVGGAVDARGWVDLDAAAASPRTTGAEPPRRPRRSTAPAGCPSTCRGQSGHRCGPRQRPGARARSPALGNTRACLGSHSAPGCPSRCPPPPYALADSACAAQLAFLSAARRSSLDSQGSPGGSALWGGGALMAARALDQSAALSAGGLEQLGGGFALGEEEDERWMDEALQRSMEEVLLAQGELEAQELYE